MAAKKQRRRRGPNKVRRQSRKPQVQESGVLFMITGGPAPYLGLMSEADGDKSGEESGEDYDAARAIKLRLHDIGAVRRALDAFEAVCGDGSGAGAPVRRGRRAKRSDAGQPRGPRDTAPARRGPGRPPRAEAEAEEIDITTRKGKKRKKRNTDDE